MISISVYRRYTPPAWAARQARYVPAGPSRRPPEGPSGEPPRPGPAPPEPRRGGESPGRKGLAGLLPPGLDFGDLFLAAMLLFLYSESRDEDFLIILIVVGLSIFQTK